MSAQVLYRGAIFHLIDDPNTAGDAAYEYWEDGALVVEDGMILSAGAFSEDNARGAEIVNCDGLIVPGLIDAHVHYPQTDMIAAYGEQLLGWLETYTFPMEQRFADPSVAADTASFFLDELLRNGTTCAAVFATVHRHSVDALFEAAEVRKMRLIAGKVLMDRNAPEALRDTAEQGLMDSAELIEKWHGRGRLSYAVTPRFALTSTEEQLAGAGKLCAAHPGVYMHTHLAENVAECAAVAEVYPEERDYLAVYEKFGLARERAIFAHGIYLSESEFTRLAESGSAIAFCPGSNMFLGSGLFKLREALAHKVHVALGSDVGGGDSFSMLRTMGEAYKVCQLGGSRLDAFGAFYLATLGAARALKLDEKIGNLAPGKEADFLVLDLKATALLARRLAHATNLHDKLFALAILGDDRIVAQTYVAGKLAYRRVEAHQGAGDGQQ